MKLIARISKQINKIIPASNEFFGEFIRYRMMWSRMMGGYGESMVREGFPE